MLSKVYILILNWNGWKDTIECLESVFRNQYEDYQVIVCDNNSQDGSLEYIKLWAKGYLEPLVAQNHPLRNLSFPPVKKPIPYIEYDRKQAEAGGNKGDSGTRLILIQTGANLGFAGGNNVGLRYALARNDFDYVWLLNNDTVIKPDALTHMVRRMKEKPQAGMCGSTLLYYHEPEKVQALGGAVYNKWFAIPRHIGTFRKASEPIDREYVESKMKYVVGASMLVSKWFLKDIGLMCEDYFLYFEELDWAMRARGYYTFAYAPKSIIYHKEGASIGSGSKAEKSVTADYYGIKNRLVFTRKFFPSLLFTVYLGLLVTAIRRIYRKQFDRLRIIINIMFKKKEFS